MKTYLKYILAPTAIAITLTGCFDLASPASDADESVQATLMDARARDTRNSDIAPAPTDRVGSSSFTGGCKFTDRRTVQILSSAQGVIRKIGFDQERREVIYAIEVPKTNNRYMACDLPANLQRDGLTVLFGGEEKEIFPEERWMATPFEMSDIRIQ